MTSLATPIRLSASIEPETSTTKISETGPRSSGGAGLLTPTRSST